MSNNNANTPKWIQLPNDSSINQKVIDELDKFLSMSSPQTVSRSLNYVFYMYLYYENDHPDNFKFIAEDFYLLHEFFDGISTSEIVKSEL